MLELVSVEDARYQLRLDDPDSDGGADDGWLAIFIPAVSAAVALWLKDEWRVYLPELDSVGVPVLDSNDDPIPALDSSGAPIVHPTVRAAVLIELASQFRFREGEGKDNVVTPDAGYGYTLNKASTALLTGLRRPTVA
ncbi:hypothetical protein [Luteimonas saliphila]|uniref:hypothetical protein n=1 Tax=Luteimonas saliphila TaxID=2804919 RepID=UPI00192D3B87|nr:hypothetical protein [Luteimonas saliphila]